jgi:hypothetical protein
MTRTRDRLGSEWDLDRMESNKGFRKSMALEGTSTMDYPTIP